MSAASSLCSLSVLSLGAPLLRTLVGLRRLRHGGAYYFFFNNWGDCPGIDCCDTEGGCWSCCMRGHGAAAAELMDSAVPPPQPPDSDCTDFFNHTIVAYKSTDLVSFEPLGDVFALDPALGIILYRPHVLYNPVLKKFVLWYKTLVPKGETGTGRVEHWYGVAAADTPGGPFEVLVDKVPGMWMGDGGTQSDHYLFLDDDGSAWFARSHSVQKLNATFTGFVENEAAMLPSPASWEAPIMFKRGERYFVIGGHNCCACRGGSNAFVFTALGSPLANWSYVGDIGDNRTECALQDGQKCTRGGHSDLQWIDHSQTSAVFSVDEVGKNEATVVMLSNQWVSAAPPKRSRNADLLFWNALSFDEKTGMPEHIQWSDTLRLNLKLDDDIPSDQ